jgi:acetyl esterase
MSVAKEQEGVFHPQVAAFLDQLQAQGAPSAATLSVQEVRALQQPIFTTMGIPPEPVAEVTDRTIPGPGGELSIRIYTPEGSSPFPVLVYLHGGGWIAGDLNMQDDACRSIANEAGCAVVSVEYRLAPEYRFPAAVHDSHAVARWVADNAGRIRVDPARMAIGGESAGGNLTAAVTLKSRAEGGPPFVLQVLVNPCTNLASMDTDSYRAFAEGFGLRKDEVEWCRDHYLSGGEDAQHPYASPLLAEDLRGLPPALIITSEFGVLRDEGEAYGQRLEEAGVPTTVSRYDGVLHGFFAAAAIFDLGHDARAEVGAALRAASS